MAEGGISVHCLAYCVILISLAVWMSSNVEILYLESSLLEIPRTLILSFNGCLPFRGIHKLISEGSIERKSEIGVFCDT